MAHEKGDNKERKKLQCMAEKPKIIPFKKRNDLINKMEDIFGRLLCEGVVSNVFLASLKV